MNAETSEITIRSAHPKDAAALLAIYAPYILGTSVTYECKVPSVREFRKRIRSVLKAHVYLVAELDGRIAGYAYAAKFHARKAFERSVEISIYLEQGIRHRGLGTRLYTALEQQLKSKGFTTAYALIASTHRIPDEYLSPASIRFHQKMGFHPAGRILNCAYKFGRWYDMVYMEKHLVDFSDDCPSPEEAVDGYTRDRIPLGIPLERGKIQDAYELVVHICLFNKDGKMLIQHRSETKRWWAGFWDFSAAGAVDYGEQSASGAMREIREELGISVTLDRPVLTRHYQRGFGDFYVELVDIELSDCTLQENEVQEIKWADCQEVKDMMSRGEFCTYSTHLIDLLFEFAAVKLHGDS